MDAVLLSRTQFGANTPVHILFPTLTIALGWVLLYPRVRHTLSGDARWIDAYGFRVKVLALSFALGVVAGITMSFQFGTAMSAFWIIVLNSWMHTPAGFEMRDGMAHATDWLAIVFNPSMPYRQTHMPMASGLTVAFVVAGLSALRWLIDRRPPGAADRPWSGRAPDRLSETVYASFLAAWIGVLRHLTRRTARAGRDRAHPSRTPSHPS